MKYDSAQAALQFFSFFLFKGAQAFCVSLPTIVDGVSYPDAAFALRSKAFDIIVSGL